MSWKCAVCGAQEGEGDTLINGICHHCGKPLCQEHQIVLLDSVFGHDKENPRAEAIHCADCRRKYHRFVFGLRKRRKP